MSFVTCHSAYILTLTRCLAQDEDNVRSFVFENMRDGQKDRWTLVLSYFALSKCNQPANVTLYALFVLRAAYLAQVDCTSSNILPLSLSIGLSDCTILLYRGLDRSLSSSSPIPEPRIDHEIATKRVKSFVFTTAPPSVLMDPFSSPSVQGLSNPASAPTGNFPNTGPRHRYQFYPNLPKLPSPTAALVDEIGAGLRCACIVGNPIRSFGDEQKQ